MRIRVFLLSGGFILLCTLAFTFFMQWHEVRVDELNMRWDDPVLKLLPAADCSIVILILTYGSVGLYMLSERHKSYFISRFMAAYGLLLLFRIMTLSILPLKEPADLIFLNDPFLNTFIYQGGENADLFFSGHTGTLFLLYFLSGRKWYFLLAGLSLGILLMIQRVHYSIDIVAAIPFAFVTVRIVESVFIRVIKSR